MASSLQHEIKPGSYRQLRVFAWLVVVFWCVLVWVASATTREVGHEGDMVAHTHEVLGTITALESRVTDVETAERGFVITGNETYLEPTRGGASDISNQLHRLSQLTADNPTQRQNLIGLDDLFSARLAESRQVVAVRRARGMAAARILVESGVGKNLHDDIRARLGTMTQVELALLRAREQRASDNRKTADLSMALALGLVGIGIIVVILMGRSRIAMEQRLRRTETRYRELFESSPNPIWVTDLETKQLLLVNAAACSLYGYDQDEMIGMPVSNLAAPSDRERIATTLERAAIEPRNGSGIWRHRTKTGRELIVCVTTRPIEFDDRPARLVMTADVTERETARAELGRSEARFQQVFELQFQLMALLDRSGVVMQANSLMVAAAGGSRDRIIGRNLSSLSIWKADDGGGAVLARWIDDCGENEASSFTLRYRSAAGDVRILTATLRLVAGGDEGDYLIFQAHDVTERERALAALHRSERRLLAAQERAALGSWEIDLLTGDVWWSTKMRKLFNFPDERPPLKFEELPQLAVHEDASRLARFLDEMLHTIGSATIRFRRASELGDDCYLELVAECLYDTSNQPIQLVGTVMDVTERRIMEQHLQRAQRLEAVGNLTGGIAHDFNNLLTVIVGNSETLAEAIEESDLRELANLSLRAAARGAELTQHLLAFARRQPLEPSVVDPGQLIRDMASLLRKTVTSAIDLEIVSGAGTWRAFVDRAQLESAILNLAINARDAMPKGGRLTIEVSNATFDESYADSHAETVAGQYALIAVSDTGQGMTGDVADHAFEPFFTTKKHGTNSGLGLSMVHGFVKQSGGHINLYSEPGQGTTVKIYLPRSVAKPRNGAEAAETTTLLRGDERVLLVEDDELVREHVRRQLEGLGYDVSVAHDGRSAIAILELDSAFDLLFTDVVMPGGLNGRDLADAARALVPGLPVLFTSGYTENAVVHHGRLDYGILMLSKPYQLRTLARKVRLALDQPPR